MQQHALDLMFARHGINLELIINIKSRTLRVKVSMNIFELVTCRHRWEFAFFLSKAVHGKDRRDILGHACECAQAQGAQKMLSLHMMCVTTCPGAISTPYPSQGHAVQHAWSIWRNKCRISKLQQYGPSCRNIPLGRRFTDINPLKEGLQSELD